MRRLVPISVLVVFLAQLAIAPGSAAGPRVTVSGDAAVLGTLKAATSGGKARKIVWLRCAVKQAKCPQGQGARVGRGTSYEPQPEDVDAYLRAVAKVKQRGKDGTVKVRSAWVGPVKGAATPPGDAKGMRVGEYVCYSGTIPSTLWIDSATAYRSPNGKGGSYTLDAGTQVFTKGAVKINWTSGPYAEWQANEGFWAEYLPAGTPAPSTGQPIDKPKILMTFDPNVNPDWQSKGWTTCNPK